MACFQSVGKDPYERSEGRAGKMTSIVESMRWIYYVAVPCVICVHVSLATGLSLPIMEHWVAPILLCAMSFGLFTELISADPGLSPLSEQGCERCGRRRTRRTVHCPVCRVCVDEFDHHCDILDVCVGSGNIALFRTFLVFHALMCFYGAVMHNDIASALPLSAETKHTRHILHVLSMAELVLALTFGMFWTLHIVLWLLDMRTIDLIRPR